MRKTILYFIILALLAFSVYYFLIRTNNSNPYGIAEAGFTIKDTASIGKLFIATNEGSTITVVRTDSGWYVNNKYKALPSTLNLILITLTQQAPLYPVTKAAAENVVNALSTEGTKVEVYGKDGKKMRVFYVGGGAVNNTGTNMMIEGAQTPYVVQVPGFNGYLTSRYTANMQDWRDRTVFRIPPEEIKSVSVQYPMKPVNDFEITRDNDSVIIKANPEIMKGFDGPNTRRAKMYLKYFANVNCEGYLNGLPDMDTSLKTAPKQCIIDITGMHGQHWHLDSYWMALNKRSKNRLVSDPEVPDDYDADRLYAVINNGRDTVMIQQQAFRDIFHKAFEFFQKDGTGAQPKETPRNVLMHNKP